MKGKRWDKRQGGKLKLMLHFIEINALTSADASHGGSTLPLKIERILGYYHNITLRISQTIFLMNMMEDALIHSGSLSLSLSLSLSHAVRHVLCR